MGCEWQSELGWGWWRGLRTWAANLREHRDSWADSGLETGSQSWAPCPYQRSTASADGSAWSCGRGCGGCGGRAACPRPPRGRQKGQLAAGDAWRTSTWPGMNGCTMSVESTSCMNAHVHRAPRSQPRNIAHKLRGQSGSSSTSNAMQPESSWRLRRIPGAGHRRNVVILRVFRFAKARW